MEQVYLGIDVGNTFSEIVFLNEEAVPLYADRIATLEMPAWRELLDLLEGCEIHAAFEIGTHYGWLYDLLKEYCTRVDVVNAEAFAVISKSQKKTDKIDALKLAEGAWRGDLPTVTVPEKPVRQDRRLVAHIHHHSKSISRVKILIRNMLYTARIVCPYKDVMGVKAQKWLKQTALPMLDEQERLLLGQLLEQLELLIKQGKKLVALAPERVKRYADAEIAQSVPGFGSLVTLAFLCAVAGIRRFDTPDQLAQYFGLCGKVDQSGHWLRLGGITRRGNKHVRWLLGQAVTHLIRKDPKARKRYMKLRRKKPAKVARVAVMRWLVTVLWRMLNNQEKYRLNGVAGNHLNRKAA